MKKKSTSKSSKRTKARGKVARARSRKKKPAKSEATKKKATTQTIRTTTRRTSAKSRKIKTSSSKSPPAPAVAAPSPTSPFFASPASLHPEPARHGIDDPYNWQGKPGENAPGSDGDEFPSDVVEYLTAQWHIDFNQENDLKKAVSLAIQLFQSLPVPSKNGMKVLLAPLLALKEMPPAQNYSTDLIRRVHSDLNIIMSAREWLELSERDMNRITRLIEAFENRLRTDLKLSRPDDYEEILRDEWRNPAFIEKFLRYHKEYEEMMNDPKCCKAFAISLLRKYPDKNITQWKELMTNNTIMNELILEGRKPPHPPYPNLGLLVQPRSYKFTGHPKGWENGGISFVHPNGKPDGFILSTMTKIFTACLNPSSAVDPSILPFWGHFGL